MSEYIRVCVCVCVCVFARMRGIETAAVVISPLQSTMQSRESTLILIVPAYLNLRMAYNEAHLAAAS